jgi:pheromone a factor receptor
VGALMVCDVADAGRYIFQDLFTGGDLFSYFSSQGQKLSPAETGLVVLQIAKGLEYLHGQGIVHRDLKPENVLMAAPMPASRIVLADFGSSRYIPKIKRAPSHAQRMFSMTGTLDYAAP